MSTPRKTPIQLTSEQFDFLTKLEAEIEEYGLPIISTMETRFNNQYPGLSLTFKVLKNRLEKNKAEQSVRFNKAQQIISLKSVLF